MPTGPQGQKRPADAVGLAVLVGKIATGEVDDPAVVNVSGERRSIARTVVRKSTPNSEGFTQTI